MGKFTWFSVIPHNKQTLKIFIDGNTEVENQDAEITEKAKGLHGAVKVTVKNLFVKEDSYKDGNYRAVETYKELSDLLLSSYSYSNHLIAAYTGFKGGSADMVLLRNSHLQLSDSVFPTLIALSQIDTKENQYGHGVWLDSAIDDLTSEEKLALHLNQTPAPPCTRPVPAPRKKVPTALVPAPKTVSVSRETAPPPAYEDLMKPPQENGMEDYYGRGAQATAPKAPTVEIIPSIRDLHHPASTQQVVFRTHTAHQTPSVLDRIGTMTLDAASRIAEANSSLATAALQKMKKLRVTKTYGYGVT